jgi:hypothetical protein
MSENGPSYERGPSVGLSLDVPLDIARALDAWRSTQPTEVSRSDGILIALRDWLTVIGLLPQPGSSEGLH